MAGQFDSLVGDLQPGDDGWLPLDDAGYPSGPATKLPPPPPALACSVTVNSTVPLPPGESLLLSETGAELVPPLTSNTDPRDPDTWVAPPVPVIISLTPNTVECNSPDVEMMVEGTGFSPDSVIVFNGYDEPTDYFSPTSIGTGIKPSLFEVAAVCPVIVRGPGGESNSLDFTFTDPVARRIDEFKRGH
jgi:hypothetical protein